MTRPLLVSLLILTAAARALAQPALALVPLAGGFDRPVQVVAAHDGSGALYVAQQGGKILRLDPATGARELFLDLSPIVTCCTNGGLLSIVFHPRYASNGFLFVQYADVDGDTVVARYTRSDPASATVLFVAPQPRDNVPNHHGGTLQFGPDGMLYISIGDGGAYRSVTNRAPETTHLLGKLLRVDVDRGALYTIPPDNPLIDAPGARGEIWSLGLRNPWRFSFDRATGELLLGDVGQDSWEEIDALPLPAARGANFGWPAMEASHCFPPGAPCTPTGVLPRAEYSHTDGCSVTGGYRYRGARWPSLAGIYFYGDYCSGRIWTADAAWRTTEALKTAALIVSFGEDDDGELYVVDHAGTIFRVTAGVVRRRASRP